MDCVFCKIAEGVVPAKRVWENELFVAFEDLRPKAPVHVLIAPRQHIVSLNDAPASILQALGQSILAVAEYTGVKARGYRTIINTGVEGGQEVQHLHVHVLGGKPLGI